MAEINTSDLYPREKQYGISIKKGTTPTADEFSDDYPVIISVDEDGNVQISTYDGTDVSTSNIGSNLSGDDIVTALESLDEGSRLNASYIDDLDSFIESLNTNTDTTTREDITGFTYIADQTFTTTTDTSSGTYSLSTSTITDLCSLSTASITTGTIYSVKIQFTCDNTDISDSGCACIFIGEIPDDAADSTIYNYEEMSCALATYDYAYLSTLVFKIVSDGSRIRFVVSPSGFTEPTAYESYDRLETSFSEDTTYTIRFGFSDDSTSYNVSVLDFRIDEIS